MVDLPSRGLETATPLRVHWPIRAVPLVALIAAASAVAWIAAGIAGGLAQQSVRDRGEQRLALYASSIRNAVRRYDYLPFVTARDKDVLDLLAGPADEALARLVDMGLEAVNRRAGSADLYVVDAAGTTRAASNWREPGSFVGNSYAFRPYFRESLASGTGRYFGVGVTTGLPGYFVASVAARDGRVLGAAVVKVDLEPLQADWALAGEDVFVTDENGVVFLSSRPDFRYRTLFPLDEATRTRIVEARQYGESSFAPLTRHLSAGTSMSGQVIRLEIGGSGEEPLMMQSLNLPELGWTLRYLSSLRPVRQAERDVSVVTLGISFILAIAGLAWRQRRQALRLQRESHAALEQRVAERTRELSQANVRLQAEMEERRRAALALQRSQDELVQAGKLAGLGQMSAAIAHEINQPLAAIQTFLASTRVFAERGDLSQVRENIGIVSGLAERMAAITGHLKTFARKTPAGRREPVRLADAVAAALRLLDRRIKLEDVEVECRVAAEAWVISEGIRLEQVLLNLVGNALDAMAEVPRRLLSIEAMKGPGSNWTLSVRDSGPGVAHEVLSRLFDPFFTTKDVGKGLGLGLSLSYAIVNDFGGTLKGGNHPDGGAVFAIRLTATEPPAGAGAEGARN